MTVNGGGSADFTWTVGRLDGCPIAWPPGPLRLSACARLEAGALEVVGGGVPSAQSRLRPWIAAGPTARAEWTALAPLFVDAEIGVLFRLTNDHFYFQPDTTVYEVPLVGLNVAGGVGLRFF